MVRLLSEKSKAQIQIFLSGILMGTIGFFLLGLNLLSTNAIVALRGLFGALIIFPILLLSKKLGYIKKLFFSHPWLTILQSFTGPVLIYCYFYAIQHLGYGTAVFLLKTGPIFSVFFMSLFLKRYPDKYDVLAFLITMIGVLILTQPWDLASSSESYWKGILIGLISGVLMGAANVFRIMIFDKSRLYQDTALTNSIISSEGLSETKLSDDLIYSSLSLIFLETLVMFVMFSLLDFSYFRTMLPIHWVIAFGLGLIPTVIAFFLRNIALKHDEAGDVLIFSYSETIMGALLTAILDHELTLFLILSGMCILVANGIVALKPKKNLP
ncbi:DMT family transporter [Candidatus Lokiarchaeum ossiferum]|uniref:DMT family transporter n=1 Tax=Candidatus Lokiarchaeum ossiferum TaxID=2951803 RepID=UPI00352F1EC3